MQRAARLKKIPKKSKRPISVLQRQIWEECKRIIRKRYGNTCYTCGRTGLAGANWHTGHLFPKATLGAYLKYDLRVLRPQCYHCNINLGGNGARYLGHLREVEGDAYVDGILKDLPITVKAYDHYQKVLTEYQLLD